MKLILRSVLLLSLGALLVGVAPQRSYAQT